MILLLIALAAAQAAALPSSPDPMPPPRSAPEAQAPAEPPPTALGPVDPALEGRSLDCIALARGNPGRAIEVANAWRVEGGGIHARACLGLAYVVLERWAPAATVYEQAARDAEAASDARRADLWVQAGNAWIAAGEPTKAVLALDAALRSPGVAGELRGEIHLDRARALVALGNDSGAREDIDRALALVAADPFAWYLSAALARRANDLVRARTDIARAIQLAPGDPDIMLLAGTIAGLSGDMAQAERLYRQVAEQAPQSEAGRAAQASLASPPPAAPQPRALAAPGQPPAQPGAPEQPEASEPQAPPPSEPQFR